MTLAKTDAAFREFLAKQEEIRKRFKGLTEKEAEEICDQESIKYRVTREDKNNYIVTHDYLPERLNFEIDSGLITKVSFG